jgi:hypothetical protein
MTETIQQLKEDIAILQMKLQKLEETQMTLEKSGEFSIVSYNGETYYHNLYDDICGGWYKTDTDGEVFYLVEDETERKLEKLYQEQVVVKEPEDNEWKTVALGFGENLSAIGPCGYYDFSPGEWVEWALNAYEKTADDYLRLLKKGKEKEQKWDVVRESVKWCEEHPDESVEDYLKPQTPEQVDAGLRNAMRQSKKDGVFDEPTKPMNEVLDRLENKWNSATENAAFYITDDDLNRMLKKWEENPPEFLKFELGKTLEALITRWWCDVFTTHEDWDMETAIDDLCDRVELWLPKSQSSSGSQSLGVEDMVEGFNDCLKKIKSKLRNKK